MARNTSPMRCALSASDGEHLVGGHHSGPVEFGIWAKHLVGRPVRRRRPVRRAHYSAWSVRARSSLHAWVRRLVVLTACCAAWDVDGHNNKNNLGTNCSRTTVVYQSSSPCSATTTSPFVPRSRVPRIKLQQQLDSETAKSRASRIALLNDGRPAAHRCTRLTGVWRHQRTLSLWRAGASGRGRSAATVMPRRCARPSARTRLAR